MNKNDLQKISSLIQWKLSKDVPLDELKSLKTESDNATSVVDVSVFAKKLWDELELETLYNELGIHIPDFTTNKHDDVNEGIKQIDKNLFKWM